jgi:hypothetical protein
VREISGTGEGVMGGGAQAGGRGRVGLDRFKMDMYIFAVYMGEKCTMYRLFVTKCTRTNLQQDLMVEISPEHPQLCGIAAFKKCIQHMN